jgi:hypothetical protein
LIKHKLAGSSWCFNQVSVGATQEEWIMISAIILLLAILTAGLVVGVFVVALMELNEIDEISNHHHH